MNREKNRAHDKVSRGIPSWGKGLLCIALVLSLFNFSAFAESLEGVELVAQDSITQEALTQSETKISLETTGAYLMVKDQQVFANSGVTVPSNEDLSFQVHADTNREITSVKATKTGTNEEIGFLRVENGTYTFAQADLSSSSQITVEVETQEVAPVEDPAAEVIKGVDEAGTSTDGVESGTETTLFGGGSLLSTFDPKIKISAKWKTSSDAYDPSQYDTMQTGENVLVSISFDLDAETTDKTVTVKIPRGIIVASQTAASGSAFFSDLQVSSSGEGTTLVYSLLEGVNGTAGIEVELQNNPNDITQDNTGFLFAPGDSFDVETTYSFTEESSTEQSVTEKLTFTVKDFDLMLDFASDIHELGSNPAHLHYGNAYVDVSSFDNYWTEAEHLKEGVTASHMVLMTISDEETSRNRQSAITDLKIYVPLPSNIDFEGIQGIYADVSAYYSIAHGYNTTYDPDTHCVVLTMKKSDRTGLLLNEELVTYLTQDDWANVGVYKIMLPALLACNNATDNSSYASSPVKVVATDVRGEEHIFTSEKPLTVNTYQRGTTNSFNLRGLSPVIVYLGGTQKVDTVDLSLTHGSFLSRPMLHTNANVLVSIPDGFNAKTLALEGFDVNPIRTPTTVKIKYKTENSSDYQELETIVTFSPNNSLVSGQSASIDLTPLANETDRLIEVLFEFDQFGTVISVDPNKDYRICISGVAYDTFLNGDAISDYDRVNGSVAFWSDQIPKSDALKSEYPQTYRVQNDLLNVYIGANTYGHVSSDSMTLFTWGEKLLKTTSPDNAGLMEVFVDNPVAGSEHSDVYVTVRPENGIKITHIGQPRGTAFTKATIKLSDGTTYVHNDLQNSGYKPAEGIYIEEIEYYAPVVTNGVSYAGHGWGTPLWLPVYIWAPYEVDFPFDGTGPGTTFLPNISGATTLLSARAYSNERPESNAIEATGELCVTDTLNYLGVNSTKCHWENSSLNASPAFATPGDNNTVTVSGAYPITAAIDPIVVNATSINGQVGASKDEYGYYPDRVTMYYRLDKHFDYVNNSAYLTAEPGTFGYEASVADSAIPEYFDNGDTLIKLEISELDFNFYPDGRGLWFLNVYGLKTNFEVIPKINAPQGVYTALTEYWYEIADDLVGTVLPNKSGSGYVTLRDDSNGYKAEYASSTSRQDTYDVNGNGDFDEWLGDPSYSAAGPQITLNARTEEGVFNFGASENDPVLSIKEHRGWNNDEFSYQLNIISQLGTPMNNFVAYIPLASIGDSKGSEFDFELKSLPDFSLLGLGANYTISYSTDQDPTTNELNGGTDSGYKTGTPDATELKNITMIKITATEVPAYVNDIIPFELLVKGKKPKGNPTAYMFADYTYDQYSGGVGQTVALPYTLENAKVSGMVWHDNNRDGVYNTSDDSALSNVTVSLYDALDVNFITPIDSIDSGLGGSYVLESPLEGNFVVKANAPAEKAFVAKGIDSVVNVATGISDAITLGLTETTNQNIGLYTNVYGYTVNYYKDSVADENLVGTENGTSKFLEGYSLKDTDIAASTDLGSSWLNLHKPIEGYEDGSSQNLPFIITATESNNVINVVYTKANFGYTIEHYVAGVKNDSLTDTGTAEYQSQIIGYTDKAPYGYKIDPATPTEGFPITITVDAANNVGKVYYVKDDSITQNTSYTVEYYKDNVKVIEDSYTETSTDWVHANPALITISKDIDVSNTKYEGYKLDTKASDLPAPVKDTQVANGTVIKVYYEKDDFGYAVKYYVDNVYQASWDEVGTAIFQSTISAYPDKCPDGYALGSTVGLPIVISANVNDNVGKVYYEKRTDLQYTVEYYQDSLDGVLLGSHAVAGQTFEDSIIVGDGDVAGQLNWKKPMGYKDGVVDGSSATVVSAIASNNVVKVIYTKDSFDFSIKYYVDGAYQSDWDETGTAEFKSSVFFEDCVDKCPVGYKFGSVSNLPMTISAAAANNVAHIYYIKDDGQTQPTGYTVEYYQNGVKVEADSYTVGATAWVNEVKPMITIANTIDVSDTKYAGFRLDSTTPSNIPTKGSEVESGSVFKLYYVTSTVAYTIEYHDLGWLIESPVASGASTRPDPQVHLATDTVTDRSIGDTVVLSQEIIDKYKPSDRHDSGVASVATIKLSENAAANKITVTYLKRNMPPVISVAQNVITYDVSESRSLIEVLQEAGTVANDREDGTYELSYVDVSGWESVKFGTANNSTDPYVITMTATDSDGYTSNRVSVAIFVTQDGVPPVVTAFYEDGGAIGSVMDTITDFFSTIYDDGTALGNRAVDCWVHWYILMGIIVSSAYAAAVVARRRKFTHGLSEYENLFLNNTQTSSPSVGVSVGQGV